MQCAKEHKFGPLGHNKGNNQHENAADDVWKKDLEANNKEINHPKET